MFCVRDIRQVYTYRQPSLYLILAAALEGVFRFHAEHVTRQYI